MRFPDAEHVLKAVQEDLPVADRRRSVALFAQLKLGDAVELLAGLDDVDPAFVVDEVDQPARQGGRGVARRNFSCQRTLPVAASWQTTVPALSMLSKRSLTTRNDGM